MISLMEIKSKILDNRIYSMEKRDLINIISDYMKSHKHINNNTDVLSVEIKSLMTGEVYYEIETIEEREEEVIK